VEGKKEGSGAPQGPSEIAAINPLCVAVVVVAVVIKRASGRQ
jgi:hypothetical protein